MKKTCALLVAAGLAYAGPSAAADSGTAPAPTAARDDRVCFAEKTTGSHLRRRICMTREEQEQRRKEDQEAVRQLRRSSSAAGASRGRD